MVDGGEPVGTDKVDAIVRGYPFAVGTVNLNVVDELAVEQIVGKAGAVGARHLNAVECDRTRFQHLRIVSRNEDAGSGSHPY